MLLIQCEVKQAAHALADLGLEGVFADYMLNYRPSGEAMETADNIAVQLSVSDSQLVQIVSTVKRFRSGIKA